MRIANLFNLTLRDAPSEAETTNHKLLLRAGYMRQSGTGIFSLLPLGLRTRQHIAEMIQAELVTVGAQEVHLPTFQPADLWKDSGRWYQTGRETARLKDRTNRDWTSGSAHEEIVAALARDVIRSHRQLPVLIYQIQDRWCDDARPHGGLLHSRESAWLEVYSLDANQESLDKQYQSVNQAFMRVFNRLGLTVISAEGDPGLSGGQAVIDTYIPDSIGEDTLLTCETCGYTANRSTARFKRPVPTSEEPLPLEKVSTPHSASIEDLAAFLQIPRERTAKAVFLTATLAVPPNSDEAPVQELIFAIVRGDMEVSETKLANLIGAVELKPSFETEIRSTGAVPGYASPVGIRSARVIVDELVPTAPNLVAGANEEGFHLRNVNFGRDYTAGQIADIAIAFDGCGCPQCGAPLHAVQAVNLGGFRQWGERFTTPIGAVFSTEDGQSRPVLMGAYHLNLDRLLACLVELHHDDHGLVWPRSISPYPIHLVRLGSKDGSTETLAANLYQDLCKMGLEPLFDDRSDSPGVKFNDADLIGLPLRLTVSERALKQGGIEFKRRTGGQAWVVPLEETLKQVKQILSE